VQDLGLYWTPTVGSPILPDPWLNMFKAGTYNHIPLIIGHTGNEGRLFTAIYENANRHALTELELVDRGVQFFSVAAPLVLAVYNPLQYPSPSLTMSAVVTDALFACGENRDRAALVATSAPAVYSYQFTDPNAFEVEVHGIYTPVEDGHDAELPFLFQYNHGRIGPANPPFSPAQLTIAIQMGRYWGNFARTGNPNGMGLPAWSRFTSETHAETQSLQPGGARAMTPGAYYQAHNCEFWNPLLALKS
jgi:para-nitrobenzyl esterase